MDNCLKQSDLRKDDMEYSVSDYYCLRLNLEFF